jgi:hypothetical protein
MRLRMEMTAPLLAERFKELVAAEITAAVRKETRALEKAIEAATISAGLGQRMARTWASQVYPTGKNSLSPAGVVWSKAPKAMKAFTEGANIRPVFAKMLAIPTPDGLRLMGGKRGDPVEALRKLRVSSVGRGARRRKVIDRGIELAVVPLPRGGKAQAAIVTRGATYGQSGRVRAATAGRANLGLRETSIVLFWLVPRAVIRKRLDIPPLAAAAMANIRAALATAISNAQRAIGGA